jgi:hypothetical protein
MPFPFRAGLFAAISCGGFPLQSLTVTLYNIQITANPPQYTRLIFTPAANKTGELHRIRILRIEFGSFFAKHNFRNFKADSTKLTL